MKKPIKSGLSAALVISALTLALAIALLPCAASCEEPPQTGVTNLTGPAPEDDPNFNPEGPATNTTTAPAAPTTYKAPATSKTSAAKGAKGKPTELERAQTLYNKRKYEEALKILKEYIKTKPDPKAYYLIAYSLYKLGRHDEAAEYFKSSYLVEPEYTPTPEIVQKKPELAKVIKPEGLAPSSETTMGDTVAPRSMEETGDVVVVREGGLNIPVHKPKEPGVATPPPATPAPPVANTTVPKVANAPAPKVANAVAPTAPKQPEPRALPPRIAPAASKKDAFSPEDAQKKAIALLLAFLIPIIATFVISYLFFCFCLFKIAKKLELPTLWQIFAWIPLLSTLTFIKAAGKPLWWIILLIIPITAPFVGIYCCMLISENCGKSKWFGLIVLTGIGALILPAILAFSKDQTAAGKAMSKGLADLSGEPNLDLPDDLSDMDFSDSGSGGGGGDDFGSDTGFGSSDGGLGTGDKFDSGFDMDDSMDDKEGKS